MRGFFTIVGGLLLVALGLRVLGFAEPPPRPPETSPGAALAVACDGALELDLTPLWDNLPPSWKAEAEGLVTKLQESANPELWQLGFGLLVRTADLAATPTGEAAGLDGSARLASLFGYEGDGRARLAAALRAIATSGLGNPNNLARLNLRELAGVFLPTVEDQLRALPGHADEVLLPEPWRGTLEAAAATCRSAAADQTVFTLDLPAGFSHGPFQETLQLREIEGCWVPEQLAAVVPNRLAALGLELDHWTAAPNSPRADHARKLLEAAARGMTALENAKQDPADFDAALDGLIGELTALVIGQRMRSLFE